jgi:hypothetical protein
MLCLICDETFPYRPGNWGGQHIPDYDLTVCTTCYQGNHDGWGGIGEPKILAHLKAKGVAVPARNAKGLLPRDGTAGS